MRKGCRTLYNIKTNNQDHECDRTMKCGQFSSAASTFPEEPRVCPFARICRLGAPDLVCARS
jgi:hypothetical protein